MYHIFFIYSSVDGHLACFHILAIVRSATMNTGVHVSLQTFFFFSLGICPGVGLQGHRVALFFSFPRNFHNVLHNGVPIYIPTNSVGGFPFLHTLSLSIACGFFDGGYSDWCEVIISL